MFKIFSIAVVTAGLFAFNAPAHAGSNCAYAISKLEAQIRYQQSTKDTTAATAAAAQATAYDAKAEAYKAQGATAEAAQSDAACRQAVISGWNALRG
jgi:hypothetical protein